MKKEPFFRITACLTALFAAFTLGFSSCGDDEPTPEPENAVNDPAYQIVGHVMENASALAGVTVSVAGGETATTDASGCYQLNVTKTGDYSLSFNKDGYVRVNGTATIPSDADLFASVVVNRLLTKQNAAVTAGAEGLTIEEPVTHDAVLVIPPNVLTEETPISITEYADGQVSSEAPAFLISVNLEPDGLKFASSVSLKFKNPLGTEIRFSEDGMKHLYKSSSGTSWTVDNTVPTYSEADVAYMVSISGFSNHTLTLPATVSTTQGTEVLGSFTIDNINSNSVLSTTITLPQRFGWDVDGTLADIVSSQASGLSSETVAALTSAVSDVLASTMGSAAGLTNFNIDRTLNVDGAASVAITITANVRTSSFSFPLTRADGTSFTLTIPVKQYTGTDISYVQTGGTDHSGGQGS
jgi:hypothetical protein